MYLVVSNVLRMLVFWYFGPIWLVLFFCLGLEDLGWGEFCFPRFRFSFSFFVSFCFFCFVGFGGKEETNKHKEILRDTPTFGPQPSRGCVPFVLWKCPVCPANILSNPCGITHKLGWDVPDVPGFAPKPSRGHFQGTPTTKFLYVFFVYRSFLLPSLAGRILCEILILRMKNCSKERWENNSKNWAKKAPKSDNTRAILLLILFLSVLCLWVSHLEGFGWSEARRTTSPGPKPSWFLVFFCSCFLFLKV